MKVIAVGAGPGSRELLTEQAVRAVETADRIFGSGHTAETFSEITDRFEVRSISETLGYIAENAQKDETVLVAASGDTGYYSIAATIARNLPEGCSLEFLPGISSMQMFCAMTKHSYADMKLISLHGRSGSIVPYACYHSSVFTLTGGMQKAGDILQELCDFGLGHLTCYVGENLTLPDEKICSGTAEELCGETFSDLAVMIVDNPSPADPFRVLADEDFCRGKVPMTKKAIRDLAAAELSVHPGDVVWDVGAGTGAMTSVLALKAHENIVWTAEKKTEAYELALENFRKLGIHNVRIVQGEAPEALEDFPAPDKVFIGGSSGNLREILSLILSKNPAAEVLVTAVSMETLTESWELFTELGMDPLVRQISAAVSHKLGNYHLMQADNPVWLIKGAKS
ncbi:MAG: precorrin-6y C5,15-methyltransferase (decarboxylating) subunit CbiE [Eubacterium sp.]|nr:precorrin-6y C5,15-methyltransferase (decarboxylating) subunit CbiE [Eubacterium sp.]